MELYLLIAVLVLLVILIVINLFKQQSGKTKDIDQLLERNIKLETEISSLKATLSTNANLQRKEMAEANQRIMDSIFQYMNRSEESTHRNIESFAKRLAEFSTELNNNFSSFRDIMERGNLANRKETTAALASFEEKFSTSINTSLKEIGSILEKSINKLSNENAQKLDQMRYVVEEKLQSTLEKRLGESFRLVSDRLEKVQQGLGEMQTLATGVGDLKKVLSNVKNRGMIGEYQLENILEQILTADQYIKNAHIGGGRQVVEFAVKLPGRSASEPVLLPIDAKFPIENYHALNESYDSGETALIELHRMKLINSIKSFAKDISSKYIKPPYTTDFAIMFLPVEGLYAEVLRTPGIFELLQNEYKIIISGPTTLSALLNSLSMGFRTLAIEKRSSEVWEVLSGVKTEFSKFEVILKKAKDKIFQAGDEIDKLVGARSRAISRKLKDIESSETGLLSDANRDEEE